MAESPEHQAFRLRVDEVLETFARQEGERLVAIDPELRPVADQLAVSVSGGKRLRAAFCYWGWRAAGQPDSEELVRAAAAMELVHAAAVVHDDLIDDSSVRHGRPSAHVALRAAFPGGADARACARTDPRTDSRADSRAESAAGSGTAALRADDDRTDPGAGVGAESGTRADSAARARALALLTGDLLASWAGQVFTSCGLPSAFLARARLLWAARRT